MKTVENNRKVDQKDLEKRVKKMYQEVALKPEVKYHFEMGRPLAERLGYSEKILDRIPAEAIQSFAGVGYFFDFANLQKGEFVLDLGSGSGMDVFYAALEVGKEGGVIGIDMTKEQLEKSIRLKDTNSDFDQVNFQEGYIEALPIVSNTIDVVISNGVINLSSEKGKVFNEIARVLKPGGRLVLADIVTFLRLPKEISCDVTLWAACIGGAMEKNEYFGLIEAAGMEVVKEKSNPYEFLSKNAIGASFDYGIESISLIAIKK